MKSAGGSDVRVKRYDDKLFGWLEIRRSWGAADVCFTPAQMRRLAAMLTEAADKIDKLSEKCIVRWCGNYIDGYCHKCHKCLEK